ncbi:MAG: hypothetical protein ACTSPY_07710 [Candidatus Helarchaeota archaeon]
MERPHINNVLMDILKLNESDVITYLTILNYGPITIGEISSYSKIEYLELTLCIERLKKRKLVVELPGIIKNYQALPPYKGYLDRLSNLGQSINVIIRNINNLTKKTEQKLEGITISKIEEIKTEYNTHHQAIETDINLVNKKVNDTIKITKNEINKQITVIHEELITLADKYLQDFEKILSEIKAAVINKIGNLNMEVEDISNKNKAELNLKLEEFIQLSKDDTQKIIENAIEIFNNVLNTFSNEVINLRQTFSQSIIDFLNNFKESSIEVEKLERNLIKKFNDQNLKIFTEVQTSIKEHIEENINQSSELSLNFSDKFINMAEQIGKVIESEIDNLHTKEVELISGLLSIINEIISNFDTEIVESLSTGKNKLIEYSENIENKINEIFNAHFKEVDKNIGEINNILQENIEILNTSMVNLTENLNKEITEGFSQHLDKFFNISKQLEVNITDDLKGNLNKYLSSTGAFLGQFSEKLKLKLNKTREGLTKLKTEISEKTGTAQEQFKERLDKLNNDLKQLIKNQVKTVNTNITPVQTKLSEIINDEIKNILEDSRSIKSESISFLQNGRNALANQISVFKEGIETLIKKIFQEIDLQVSGSQEKLILLEENFDNIFEKRIQNIIDSTQKFNVRLQEEFKNQFNLISQAATIIEDNLGQVITELSSNYNILIENIKSFVSAELTREITTSEELLSTLLTSFDKTVNTNLEYIKTNVDELINNISSIITTISDENKNLNEMYVQKIEEMLKVHNITFDQKNKDLINEITKIGNTYIKKSQSDFQEKLNDFIQHLHGIKKEFSDTVNNIENKIKKRININSKLFSDSFMNINKSLTAILMDLKNRSSQSLLNLKDYSNENIEEYISTLKYNFGTLESMFSETLNNLKTNIKTFLKDLQTQSLTLYNDKVSSGTKMITDVRGALENSIESSSTKLKESIKGPQSKLENIILKNAQNLEKFSKTINSSISSSIQWVIDEYNNINTLISNSIDDLIKSRLDQDKLISDNSKENIQLKINDQKNFLENTLNEIQNRILKLISSQKDELINKNEMAQKIFESIAINQRKALIDEISAISKKFMDHINKLKKDTADSEILLRNIWQELEKMQKLRETGTWGVKTLTAVIEHIKDMISRTKSSIILLIPDSTRIPFDVLSKIKPQIDVKLYTEISETLLNSNEMKTLLKKDNIIIFDIKENFYGAFRDKEEVLIAPNEPNEEKVSGIISVQEGHLDLFFNIIGPIYDSRAKEVEK